MPRPAKDRIIESEPNVIYFKPKGIPMRKLKEVTLTLGEFEAVRLSDHCMFNQSQGAERLGVHQSTFHRTLLRARKKIADALVNGMAIKIEGGPYCILPPEDIRVLESLELERGTYKGDSMRIAVSTNGNTLDDPVESRFGRCRRFLLYDTEKKETILIENEAAQASGGAGIQAAELLARNGVKLVITGHVGGNASQTLSASEIEVHSVQSVTIREALESYLSTTLEL